MIRSFLGTILHHFPQLSEYEYDFTQHRYLDRGGRPLDASRLERGLGTAFARAGRAGEASLRRAILIGSLVSSGSGQRPEILGNLQRWNRSLITEDNFKGLLAAPLGERLTASSPEWKAMSLDERKAYRASLKASPLTEREESPLESLRIRSKAANRPLLDNIRDQIDTFG